MTTRPQSVRMNHERVKRGSLLAGVAAATWLACGVALVFLTQAWWSYAFIAVGALATAAFFVLLPRYRRARRDLARVEELRLEQARARKAQEAARQRAFSQPPPPMPRLRTPFPSS